ncbi:CHASE3 domain-containing protein, partial [Acinetobacter baumannii]
HRAHLQVLQNAIDLKLAELKKTVDLRRARGEETEKGDGSDPAFQAARAVVMTNQGKEQMEAIVNAVATIRQKEESI